MDRGDRHLGVATLSLVASSSIRIRRLQNGEFRVNLRDYLPEERAKRFWYHGEVVRIMSLLQAELDIETIYPACSQPSHSSNEVLHVLPRDQEDAQFEQKLITAIKQVAQTVG